MPVLLPADAATVLQEVSSALANMQWTLHVVET